MGNASDNHVDFSNLRILFIDDDDDFSDFAVRLIRGFGCYIRRYSKGETALKELRAGKRRYNLLITDVYMEPMSGLEVINRVRTEDQTLPIFVLSGLNDIGTAVDCIRAGALDYIEKTADRDILYNKLRELIEKTQQIQVNQLTDKQRDVLKLVLDGYSNKDISEILGRNIRTVEDQRSRLMEILGADNQIDLVKIVLGYKGSV